jgi:hypothetical protein
LSRYIALYLTTLVVLTAVSWTAGLLVADWLVPKA